MSPATKIKKHDSIIIKNHPQHEGQMFSVQRVKSDGWVITTEGHLFEPTFFDPVSDWQNYNGGVARFNGATGEVVEEKDIKKFLQGKDWCEEIAIAGNLNLSIPQVKAWLKENADLVEGDGDGSWRLKNSELPDNSEFSIDDKLARLQSLETEILEVKQVIINGFYEIGIRLRAIRDERLYELKHYQDFKKYVEGELNFSYRRSYQQITAAQVLNEILPVVDRALPLGSHKKSDMRPQGSLVEGTPGSLVEGTPGSLVEGTPGSLVEGTPGSLVEGTPGSLTDISRCRTRSATVSSEIGEKQLRPLTDESLTPDDRREIWERLEQELQEIEEETHKPPKLTTKLVEKALANWKIDRAEPVAPTFESGQICKVKLGANIGVKELAPFDGKLVRVVEQLKHGVKCAGFWGEEIEDRFRFEELIPVEDTDAQRQSVTLPVGLLKELAKRGQSIENAIANLLEAKFEPLRLS
jgi:hypothetical protein